MSVEYRVMVAFDHLPSGNQISGFLNATGESEYHEAEQIRNRLYDRVYRAETVTLFTETNKPIFAIPLTWNHISQQEIFIPPGVLKDCTVSVQILTVNKS
jgi:hypothetical protein